MEVFKIFRSIAYIKDELLTVPGSHADRVAMNEALKS
jgi:hypothetical protein